MQINEGVIYHALPNEPNALANSSVCHQFNIEIPGCILPTFSYLLTYCTMLLYDVKFLPITIAWAPFPKFLHFVKIGMSVHPLLIPSPPFTCYLMPKF